jgi:hypothetical protein
MSVTRVGRLATAGPPRRSSKGATQSCAAWVTERAASPDMESTLVNAVAQPLVCEPIKSWNDAEQRPSHGRAERRPAPPVGGSKDAMTRPRRRPVGPRRHRLLQGVVDARDRSLRRGQRRARNTQLPQGKYRVGRCGRPNRLTAPYCPRDNDRRRGTSRARTRQFRSEVSVDVHPLVQNPYDVDDALGAVAIVEGVRSCGELAGSQGESRRSRGQPEGSPRHVRWRAEVRAGTHRPGRRPTAALCGPQFLRGRLERRVKADNGSLVGWSARALARPEGIEIERRGRSTAFAVD